MSRRRLGSGGMSRQLVHGDDELEIGAGGGIFADHARGMLEIGKRVGATKCLEAAFFSSRRFWWLQNCEASR